MFKKILFIIFLFSKLIQTAYVEQTRTDIKGLYEAIQNELEEKMEPLDENDAEQSSSFCQSLVGCEQGENLIRREGVLPTYNGCGSYGFIIDFKKYNAEELTLCCNSHDLCYGNCYEVKTNCDLTFLKCLENACTSMSTRQRWNQIENYACSGVIKLMYKAVKDLGCLAYVRGIDKSCVCTNSINESNF